MGLLNLRHDESNNNATNMLAQLCVQCIIHLTTCFLQLMQFHRAGAALNHESQCKVSTCLYYGIQEIALGQSWLSFQPKCIVSTRIIEMRK